MLSIKRKTAQILLTIGLFAALLGPVLLSPASTAFAAGGGASVSSSSGGG